MVPALLLIAVGPLAKWKAADISGMLMRLRVPGLVALLSGFGAPFLLGRWSPLIGLGLGLAGWIVASVAVAFFESAKRSGLAKQSSSWFGMHVAHLGIGVFVAGVTVVMGYEAEQDVRMSPGDSVNVGGYDFKLLEVRQASGINYAATVAAVELSRGGVTLGMLHPEKRTYAASSMPTTEAAIDTNALRDLYVSLGEPLEGGAWSVRAHYKPFVSWIWGGCLLMSLGGLLAVSDRRYRLKLRMRVSPLAGEVAP